MKKVFVLLGILGVMFAFNACKGNDYQHPSHRSGQVK